MSNTHPLVIFAVIIMIMIVVSLLLWSWTNPIDSSNFWEEIRQYLGRTSSL
jgi:hypothetical protein